ncbi:MAG TPA: hypothetical protein ACFE0H_15700 [Elainellaceae cyanobacterium]
MRGTALASLQRYDEALSSLDTALAIEQKCYYVELS